MNGDEVRDVRLESSSGYDASQVDDLLRRIAAELDAGRPIGPLIANAAFRLGQPGYETDAVDWFLYQLLHQEDDSELAGIGADPGATCPAPRGPSAKCSGMKDDAHESVQILRWWSTDSNAGLWRHIIYGAPFAAFSPK